MLACFASAAQTSCIPITLVRNSEFTTWIETQPANVRRWITAARFVAKPGSYLLVPGDDGSLASALVGVEDTPTLWALGDAVNRLPAGVFGIADSAGLAPRDAALGWALGAYKFTRYKVSSAELPQLAMDNVADAEDLSNFVSAIYNARDLINTPAEDLGPAELAAYCEQLAARLGAQYKQTVGDALLQEGFPTIHAVGRASTRAGRLIDISWGSNSDPKLTIVGKGVCFDSGGLDLKPSSAMRWMKKDMGGAAHALALAELIMLNRLPVRLRVLIPAVDNAVAGNAFRPGDVITTRKGLTVEIDNTDAEGRLVMCDALALASEENPQLMLDFSTLTGAARTALGTDVPAMFSNDEAVADAIFAQARGQNDPLWRMPLHKPYRDMLNSNIADIANGSASPYAGAITAALFLQEFVNADIPWVHFDLMAWNLGSRPGRPEGGEAMSIRAVFAYLADRFKR